MSIQQLSRLSFKFRTETENFVNKVHITPKQFCRIVLHPLQANHRVPALITSIILGLLSAGFIHAGCAITNAVMRKKGHWTTLQPQNDKPQKAFENTHHRSQITPKEPSPSNIFSPRLGKSPSQPTQKSTAALASASTSLASSIANPQAPIILKPVPQDLTAQEHYDQWLKLWKEGDEPKALKHLEKAAQKDHPQAKLKWAEMYFRGYIDSKKTLDEIFNEIVGIVDAADAKAKREMAEAILSISNPPEDLKKAREWARSALHFAANNGDPLAKRRLAVEVFEKSVNAKLIISEDQFAAIEADAQAGDKYACEYVGVKYITGVTSGGYEPVRQDLKKAIGFIEKAVAQSMPIAMTAKIVLLQELYGQPDQEKLFPGRNLKEDLHELLKKAELIENPGLLHHIGMIYSQGDAQVEIKRDDEKGLKFLEKAHRLHSKEATEELAKIYAKKADYASQEKASMYRCVLKRRGNP